jgi:sensor histidine kinase YesM
VWSVIIALHTVILHIFFQLPLPASFIDALIYNTLFAFIELSLWYLVQYTSSVKNTLVLVLNYLLGGILLLGIWYVAAGFLATKIITSPAYWAFARNAALFRILTGIFYFIIVSLIYYVIKYKNNWQKKIETEKKLQENIRQIELNALKAQINPHFLFNALNSISYLTVANPEKAREMIIKMSDFLRYSLRNKGAVLTTLEEELHNVKRYIDIEKIRFREKLHFEPQCAETLLTCKVPVLILQPLLENAIKHGVYNSSEQVIIRLSCQLSDNNDLILSIENNFDPEAQPIKGEGIGLQNIADRLYFIYQKNKLIRVNKTTNTFTVTLTLPQNN